MRAMTWPAFAVAVAAVTVLMMLPLLARAGDDRCMGTFKTDAVALLVRNDEVEGKEDFAVTHGNFRYLFATAESQQAFKANPARYEIQLGGACARMGALSSCADADRYAVHDGKIYIFASEGCRAGFLKDPAAALEPMSDPAPTGTADQMKRGRALIEKCLVWMGGADRLGAITTLEYRTELEVEVKGAMHRQIEATTLRLPDTIRTDYRWDDSSWIKVGQPSDSFFIDNGSARAMHPQQVTIFKRQLAREILVIMRSVSRPDFIACHLGPARDGKGEVVAVHFDSTTTELIIEPTTGYLLGIRYVDWGPKGTLGMMERRFTSYDDLGGLKIPSGWHAWIGDERAETLDQALVNVAVNPELPAEFLTRQARPIEPALAQGAK